MPPVAVASRYCPRSIALKDGKAVYDGASAPVPFIPSISR